MRKTIVADTSCFIVLDAINELDLLRQVYGEIVTTHEVSLEFGGTFPEWVSINSVKNKRYIEVLEMEIDKGEASAIALSLEFSEATLIVDDLKARKVARSLGIDFTGTFGVLLKAKLLGKIHQVKPIIEKIRSTNFRMSASLEKAVLAKAGEL
jgi:predicted nucleic acid-binding protein